MTALGAGTYGTVVARGGRAVKTFVQLDHLIQEAFMTLYMNDSPYTVNIVGYNFEQLTMETERWELDLKQAIQRYEFTWAEKMKIFRNILRGVCHLQSRHITHSDFKPSNILIKISTCDVCIADMGISSIHRYAKTGCTAKAYCPSTQAPEGMHDMFGVAFTLTEFLGEFVPTRILSPRELRQLIRKRISDPIVQEALVSMCPDEPANAATASEVLMRVFGERAELPPPAAFCFRSRISEAHQKYLHQTICDATTASQILRGHRCYQALQAYLDNPDNEMVPPSKYPIYIGAMMMIFSAVFGKPGFLVPQVIRMVSCRECPVSQKDIYRALYQIFRDVNLIRFIILPSVESSGAASSSAD